MFKTKFENELFRDIYSRHLKEESSLYAIKAVVDAIDRKSITITTGNNDFDVKEHQYDISVIIAIIRNQVNEGLNLKGGKSR